MKPFKLIKVNHNKKIYTLNDPTFIYSDDNMEDALNKIALSIKEQNPTLELPYYAWANNKSLLFNIDSIKWSGYNVNPFKSENRDNKREIDEPINYSYNSSELFNYDDINIVFSNDIPNLKTNQYYFINKKIPTIDHYKKRNKIMTALIETDIENIILNSSNYHRYDLIGILKKPINLTDIFENLSTNKKLSLIQYIYDPFKVLYKLNKKHNITSDQLSNWTNIEKPGNNKYVNIYSILAESTYCKITIDQDGIIHFAYTLNLRKNISFDEITKHKKEILTILETKLKRKIKLQEKSIKLNLQFEQSNSNIQLLVKKLGEYIDIFQVLKVIKDKDKYIINCIYKRSSNYNKQGLDISSYIKSRLEIGISKSDLIHELTNLDIKRDDAITLIDQEIDLLSTEVVNEIDLYNKKIDTIITIELYKNGYLINIYNIPTKKELENLIFWLTRILSLSRDSAKPKKKEIIAKVKLNTPPPSEKSDDKSDKSELDEVNDDLSDFDVAGGALGKEKHSYFVNLLQQADKNLFANNYAREKCQAVNQPIVMSDDQLKKLKDKKEDYFDNVLSYGSDVSIKNNYACPRLWCPQSKIPLNPDDPKAKCPIEDEEPMEIFFDKDRNKKRYVKLVKPDENGICVPCCFKKEPKEDELNKCKFYGEKKKEKEVVIEEEKEPEENYIVNQSAPISIGRYGNIPQLLHELLFPKVSFALCSKVLNKKEKCFVRRGIKHRYGTNNDSIIYAIISALKFKTKKAFIDDIKERLDLISYISLENGEVCRAFMDELPLIPDEHPKMLKEMLVMADKYFDLNDDYNKSRLLSIYNSYLKFIAYLSADDYPDNKSPYYLYSLMSELYDVLLVIWEKTPVDIQIMCPYYTCFEDIIAGLGLNPNILMLLKENQYYEPIELKLRSTEGEKLIQLNDFPNIQKLIKQCSQLKELHNHNNKIYSNIYSLNQWTKKFLINKFLINTIVISNNMTIEHFLTKGNILLRIKPISISLLPLLIKNLEITKILFYDNIIGKSFDIRVIVKDFEKFASKLKELEIEAELGKLKEGISKDIEFHTTLIIPVIKLGNNIIHTRVVDDLYKSTSKQHKINKKWYQLHLYITNVLVKKLNDTKITQLRKLPRYQMIKELLKFFDNNPDKNKIQLILEEIPLYSIKHIEDYNNDIMYYYKYYNKYNSYNINENNSEFVFSQLSLLNGIPSKLLLYHKNTPRNNLITSTTEDFILDYDELISVKMPELFNGTFEKLKTKWIMHKKSKWTNMVIIKNNYSQDLLIELYEWLAKLLNIRITFNEVIRLAESKLFKILENKEAMFSILDDPSYFNEWNSKIKKKFKTIQLFWDKYYSKSSPEEHSDVLKKIVEDKKLYPNDITILAISELLNISILTIHRGKYGKSDTDLVRGDLDDLILSSTLFNAPNNMNMRPLLILNKTTDNIKSSYNVIIEQTDNITPNSIYMQYKDVPLNIKYLVEEHLKKL